ncbi:uncharacterized protein EV420DRAFT_1511665 [Desarmillaria tabescens]|uniref:Retrotransposon gag domain-containing protein n=1 Tax=Armillaria tabescens TaxID=1929756 RepID=A0AA39NIU6_ARMTA|nr:uncharacterized protein EV420DRAFT_1511665 [Desarmillaria tabescens]KAK0466447.1 hypothetical protein EV420DRAFT_1511665 [Desarmillaria tabescens]
MMSNTSLARFEQASGSLVPIINPCTEPFTPNDFTHYEYMARSYVESTDGIQPHKCVHALSEGFRDPLIKDWFMADMHHLCSLDLTNFLLAMRMAFLPRGWDRKLRDEIRSSYQGEDESVTAWMSRLRLNNTLLRHTYFHLTNDELLAHFKSHINNSLSAAHQRRSEAVKEDDLMQWILIIKDIEVSQDAERGSDLDVMQSSPVIFKPTDPRLKRKYSSSDDEVPPKRATMSPPPSTSTSVTTVPLTPIPLSDPSVTHSPGTSLPDRAYSHHVRLPCLTDEQRDWMKEKKGCFKCRRIWAFHTSRECHYGPPDPTTYRGILMQDGINLAFDAPKHYSQSPQLLYNDDDRHWRGWEN